MKFGRYLEETQIPEWRRAYINYKGLKKRISSIRATRQGERTPLSRTLVRENQENNISEAITNTRRSYGAIEPTPRSRSNGVSSGSNHRPLERTQRQDSGSRDNSLGREGDTGATSGENNSVFRHFPRRQASQRDSSKLRSSAPLTLEEVYSSLDDTESGFFQFLDNELTKVNDFYNEREDSTMSRLSELKAHLDELAEHRRIFYESKRPNADTWKIPRAVGEALGVPKLSSVYPQKTEANPKNASSKTPENHRSSQLDPAEYQQAKHRMKKALREFYHSVELLNDYRVLNLTGFRKALKKYEKATKCSGIQDLYMKDKVKPRRFGPGDILEETLREIENIYTIRFESGDRKKTLKRLKSPFQHKSHYFSMFRSGIYLGLGLPALIFGLYDSFQPDVRRRIPQWGPLLEIYATLMAFVLFSLLIGVNLLVWNETHINYPFIFELDVRTMIDVRKYFEFPAFLFFTLSYCLFFSFHSIGVPNISSTTWPLIWLIFALVLLINPFPVFSRSSRYWLIKRIGKLMFPGWGPVEFADFWLGDEFCSLAFSMAHIFTVGCAYSHEWEDVFFNCGSSTHWVTLALLTAPYISRLVQSIRRYYDSRLRTHLINGGKYFSSIIMYVAYYTWRFNGGHRDKTFVIWCIFSTIASLYTASWDVLMDWSFFQRHSKHELLRNDLIYTNNPLIYYFAIASNIIIRFIWTIYIPKNGLNSRVRAVIAAGLEILRRFQWNFYRLENEQVGNTDQYRATREVPLPYSSTLREEERGDDEDSDDEGRSSKSGRRSSLPLRTLFESQRTGARRNETSNE